MRCSKVASILFVAHSAQPGGAEHCLDTALRHLDRSRFQPIVVFPHEGLMADAARKLGIEVIIVPLCHWLYYQRDLWYWKHLAMNLVPNVARLLQLIRSRDIDLVYTNTSAIFESALAARLARVPHVWHVHEVLKPGNSMQQLLPLRWVQCLIARLSSVTVFESRSSRQIFDDVASAGTTEVVYNSVRFDATERVPSIEDARASLGMSPHDRVVGFVGQFIDRKNPLLLVRAMAELADASHVKCLLVGDGPLGGEIRRLIEEFGLQERCSIVPFRSDVRSVLQALDVLVLPSRQESFGLVLVEAAACGKPVIACESQGPSEIIVHGETGYLVPQDDAKQLAIAIERILESRSVSREMGSASRKRVNDLFDASSNTRQLESIFDKLLDAAPNGHLATVPGV